MSKKTPLDLAREFVGLVDGLNSVPGMMTSHDMGKEAIAREMLRLHAENSSQRKALCMLATGIGNPALTMGDEPIEDALVKTVLGEIARLRAENERLRAAASTFTVDIGSLPKRKPKSAFPPSNNSRCPNCALIHGPYGCVDA